jgi:hypothetical protein
MIKRLIRIQDFNSRFINFILSDYSNMSKSSFKRNIFIGENYTICNAIMDRPINLESHVYYETILEYNDHTTFYTILEIRIL